MRLKTINNNKGSALLWVILMTIIITILMGAILASTYAYFNYTMYTVKRQQAYFTARSAISVLLEEFSSVRQERNAEGEYEDVPIAILPLPESELEITNFDFGNNMGQAKAKISRNDNDEVTIDVVATYADEDYEMKATVIRQPLYFAGVAVKNLTLNGNFVLGDNTDFYWNNTEKFDPQKNNTGNYTITINGNFVSKGDATIPAGTIVAGHRFAKTTNFVNDGLHSKKIWNPSEYIISNKTLKVDEDETEYSTNIINSLKNLTSTHSYYCNNHHSNTNFGSKVAMGSDSPLYRILGAIGMTNIMNDIADENLKITNSENNGLAIQYIEILSLSTTVKNAVTEAKQNARTLIGGFIWSTVDSLMKTFDQLTYDTLDVSYIDYDSSDENNRADKGVVPLTYAFVRGGPGKGLTLRVRYGNEPGKRSVIAQFNEMISSNIDNFINRLFDINEKPSYLVLYLEENSTVILGYDDDGRRSNDKEDLVFLYSIYGGENTHVILEDGVTVLGEIICDDLQINGNVQLIYTSTNGAQIAKQRIAEYWAVCNYSD